MRGKVVRDQDAELRSELDSLRHQNAEQRTELDSLRQQNTELDSLRHQNTEQQTELDSLLHQNAEQQTELDSLLHQNAEQQTELEALLHQNAEQLPATETQCQINETPYPFDLPLSFGLGINTQCDQWPNTNVTFGSAPLLPFPASDPFMSRGEVWNDVEFTCKPPQLSDPDPALNFIPEVVLDDWLRGYNVNMQTYPRDCTTLVPMSSSTFGNAE